MSMTMSLLNRLSNINLDLGLSESEFTLLLSICSLHWTIPGEREKIIKNHLPYEKDKANLLKKFNAPDLDSLLIMVLNTCRGGHNRERSCCLKDIQKERERIRKGKTINPDKIMQKFSRFIS